MKRMIKKIERLAGYGCLLVLLLGAAPAVLAQSIVPKAWYPLTTDKYRNYLVVQPWDVSGNALHGNTFDSTGNTLYDVKLSRVKFPDTSSASPNGQYVVQKELQNKALINIPDPGINASQPFTISFWLFFRTVTDPINQTIIKLPGMKIETDGGALVLGRNNGATLTRFKTSLFMTPFAYNWLFVSVKRSADGKDSVYFGWTPGSGNRSAMPINVPATGQAGYPLTATAQLLDSTFQGGLANVRFYNAWLSNQQIDSVRAEDLKLANGQYSAQSYLVKNTYDYYPLNGANVGKNASRFTGRDAITVSGVTKAPDRFGRTDSAASFPTTNAYIKLPAFWGTYLSNYVPYTKNNPKGFTLSYWINIMQQRSSPSGGIELPFKASDTANKIFYGRKNNQDLFGMQKIVDRLGMYRYNDITATRYPWYLWFYDPISFRKTTGWFHVIWTQYNDWLTIHFFKPDGTYFCQSMYMEIQDLNQLTDWGLGNNAGNTTAQSLILDDFRVYNWPLSPTEAQKLDSLERPPSLPMARVCASCAEKQKEVTADAVATTDNSLQVYPNPASNNVTIKLHVQQDDQVLVTIFNTEGKPLIRKTWRLTAGNRLITLEDLHLSNGLYFISIQGGGNNESRKLTILK